MKKVYSLEANGREIVSVEMDVPDFVKAPHINRQWLKGIITEEVGKVTHRTKPVRKPARAVRASRPSRPMKVAA